MIIKKPYAFLIKNFRLIHGLLFLLFVFLSIKTFNIYTFFNEYATTHLYLNQNNLAEVYVSISMYLAAIAGIIITLIIYYILSVKNKSNKMYLFIFLYCIILFMFFIYMHSIFFNLQTKSLDVESVRVMRDISLIALIPQVIFMFIIFGRALGFNLKQFDFKRDLEELEIDESDNEEVELTVGSDTYKIARFFRKLLRLTKYFILENKLFVIGIASVILVGISLAIFSKFDMYTESYNETEEIFASGLWYKVNESYLTNADKNNLIIANDKHFILINIDVSNKYNENTLINRDTFRLLVNNELLIPSFSYSEKFSDIGIVFSPYEMKAGEDKNYIVVFEINSSDIEKEYILKIKDGGSYKDIIIKPYDLNETKDMGTFVIPNDIKFDDSLLKKSVLNIGSVDMAEKFKEKYKYTIDGVEREATYSIIPSSTNKGEVTVLRIKASLKLDDDIYMKKYIKIPADLFEEYGIIRYRYQGNYKSLKLKKINVDYDPDNYSYLEVSKEIESANKIELIIAIRGVKYTIILK